MNAQRAKRERQRRRKLKITMRALMEAFIGDVRAIFKREILARQADAPKLRPPCHTCALNPATDAWDGFDATMLRLGACLESGSPFYCHEPLPTNERGEWQALPVDEMVTCAGWEVVKDSGDARVAFSRAALGERGRALTIEQLDAIADVTGPMLMAIAQDREDREAAMKRWPCDYVRTSEVGTSRGNEKRHHDFLGKRPPRMRS